MDSAVFSYSSRLTSADGFWEKLSAALKDTGWKASDRSDGIRRYERRFPKGKASDDRPDMALFSSAEELRVSYKQGKVVIAFVQTDSFKDETSFGATSEAKWADKVIWPKFDALRQ